MQRGLYTLCFMTCLALAWTAVRPRKAIPRRRGTVTGDSVSGRKDSDSGHRLHTDGAASRHCNTPATTSGASESR